MDCPAGIDGEESVKEYRIIVRRRSDGMIVRQFSAWSDFHLIPEREMFEEHLDGLECGVPYTVEIMAESFWGKTSREKLVGEIMLG